MLRRSARSSVAGACALVVFVAAACAAQTDLALHGEIDARAPSTAAEKACQVSAQALCARSDECSSLYVRFFFETVTECEAIVTDACAGRYEGPGASSDPKECTAEARAAPCEIVADPVASVFLSTPALALLRACPVTPGSIGDHAACLRDGDCASTSCTERIEHASFDSGCHACAPQRRVGEPCDGASQPRIDCESPASCIGGRCVDPAQDGAACADPGVCASGACTNGRCLPLLGEGTPCSKAVAPACDLGRGLVCADDQSCHALTIVGPGESCDALKLEIPTSAARFCDARGGCSDQGTCVALPRLGESCTTACRIGLECRNGRCVTALSGKAACVAP